MKTEDELEEVKPEERRNLPEDTSEDIFWSGDLAREFARESKYVTGNNFNCQQNGKKITLVFDDGLGGFCRDP